MLTQKWSEKNESVETSRTEIEDILPLCPLQESLLFHLAYDPDVADIYLSQTVVGLKGILDENTLKKAAAFLLDRHSSLRASFEFEGVSRPVQIILAQSPVVWSRTDLKNVPPSEKEEKLRDLLAEDLKQPFPSAPPSLVRFKLIQLTEEEYRFVITSHHILFDGWSAMVMLKELLTAYSQNGSAIDLPPPTPYREYLLWLSRQDRELAVQLWRESFSGLKEGTFLAPRLPQQSAPVHERHIEFLPEDLTLALVDSARKHGVTLNAVIQTAWALLLGRMTHRTDVVFGGTVSGRPPSIEGIESMVGLFAETLPVRIEFRSTDRWIDLVKGVHKRQSRLMDYHYIGLAEIQRVSGLTQLFDTLLVFQNYPVIRNFFAEMASGLYVTSIQGRDDSHYPLSIMVVPGQRLELSFSYRVDAFSHGRICTIAEELVGLLKAFVAQPEGPVSLNASCSELQAAAGYRLKGQPCDLPAVNGLAELIEAQVSRTSDRIAVVDGEHSFTYAEINQQANCLAHYLIDCEAGPEDMIAVILDRSIHSVLALLACLKCGAAYVPINPEYPPERIERILQLARPKVILSTSAWKPAAKRHSVCPLDEQDVMREIMAKPRTDPRQQDRILPLDLNHPIYVIFTSGTTGVPKGVVMRAVAILNLVKWHDSEPQEGPPANVAQFTSLGFDVSIQEILHSLSTGKTLHIVPETARHDPEEFVEWLERNDINLLFAPSLVIGALCIAASDKNIELKALTIIQGGEPLVITEGLRRQFASGAGARRLLNHYGPSETHAVTAYRLPANPADWPSHVPIGSPIANTQMYVLNESLAPIQPGESGELYIAGVALARGYLNHPALTAERFVADPFGAPGDRMYRTGDLVSVNEAGMLEFIGRIDNQVKIGGVRIEPGEIETALLRIEGILQCAVLVAEIQGKKQLAAYIVWQENRKSGIADIRQQLRRILPEYMVPHRYCFVDKLPLTFNGKLDRNSLLALLDNEKYRAPQSKEEEILCNLYAEVLQTPKVGPEDDFFALGGDSLLATRLIGRLRSTVHLELNIRHLFEFPRICELAQQLVQQRKKQEVLVPQPRPERLPLSYGQQRLWFIDRLEGSSRKYNLMESLRLRGELNVTALEKAINTIVERHEVLRTHFREVDGEPWQVIEPVLRIPIAFEDWRGMAKEEKESKVAAALESEGAKAFDLEQAPLLRIRVLRLEDQEHILLRTVHHIVSDGWSEGVFNRELMALYQAYCEGAENLLPPLPIQYADFTLWQRKQEERGELEEGLKYWKEKLAGIPEELNLAVEQKRRDAQRLEGDVQRSAFSAELTAQIKQVSQDAQASTYMTLLAAFVVLLARHSGQEDIVVGSPIANRQESKLEGLIGFFVNTLAMRVRAQGGTSFRKLLEEVKRTALEAYQYQDVPFERLVAELSPERQWNRTPLFQVAFALQNAPWTFPAMRDVSIETLDNLAPLARYDLEVHGWEEEGKIQLFWLYRRGLFEPWRIRQMAGHYERILAAITGRPEEKIDHIDLLTNEERDTVLYKWNKTAAAYPEEKCVHELFEEQAVRTPEAVAMVSEDQQLTYRELDRRGNQLAHYLRSLGVKPDARVGICVERGPEMIIALLAVLKAGGAYVPLDPEYPDERLQFMLEDSAPMVLLTQGKLRERFKGMKEKLLVVNLNDAACAWADQPENNPSPAVTGLTPRNMAYVIYTSGSTGRPKAVMVEHRSVSNLITWVLREFKADDKDAVLHKSAFNFDASVWEIFLPLITGGRLVMAAAGEHRDTNYLVRLIVREGVTIMLFIPSMLPFFLQEEGLEEIDSLKHVICGGEALSPQLLHLFFNHFRGQGRPIVKLNNFYGPTETTVGSLNWLCSPAPLEIVPIGRPISNTRAYVLDTQGRPVPVGLVGELYIGGAGVVRGYLNRAELTAERFVPDPFAGEAGARMYRTGDLARYQPDGNLEFLGRIDDQVKIRGFRVELGEIETVLREHELISDAVVAVRGDREQPRLVGYVVRRAVTARSRAANSTVSDDSISTGHYREQLSFASPVQAADSEFVRNVETYLKRRLPDYMVPSNIVLLESLPVGLNGKIDRRALPEPSNTAVHPYVAPATLEEGVLCRAFQELLGAQEVGVEDDFFELGGHSLLATRLTSRIRALLGVNLPIRAIFEARTVRELGALVAFIRNGSTGPGIGAAEGVEEEL